MGRVFELEKLGKRRMRGRSSWNEYYFVRGGLTPARSYPRAAQACKHLAVVNDESLDDTNVGKRRWLT